jgi:pimeloyl-ACP methyl ester carboxylesterase
MLLKFRIMLTLMICRTTAVTPENLLLHDVPDKDKWLSALQPQPARGWDDTITYCGWRHVPSIFVVAKQDRLLPEALQLQLAQSAVSEVKVVDAGHQLMLVRPREVADIIKSAA